MNKKPDIADKPLRSGNLEQAQDPYALFADWFEKAEAKEPNDANAVALATVGTEGMPSVRMVLMKGFDDQGFVFYTNLGSRKARELSETGKAALCFHWKSLRRQVRVTGDVSPVSDEEADIYFASRARLSRIGAWASRQSQPLESRFALEKSVAKETARFGVGTIPRPEFWSGFRIAPREIEFWNNGEFRLHDRFVFKPDGTGGWTKTRLYP